MKITVKELRRLLFENPKYYGVLYENEYSNSELRTELFKLDDSMKLNYKVENNCVLVWGAKQVVEYKSEEVADVS